MCGLAFSGKTTLAIRLANLLGAPRISLDEINASRGLRGGEGLADAQWEQTSQLAVSQLTKVLESGESVVLDDTLSHRFLRDRYRRVAKESQSEFVLLFLDTERSLIEARIKSNAERPSRQHVKAEVFSVHKSRFQRPAQDERPVRLASHSDIEDYLASLR